MIYIYGSFNISYEFNMNLNDIGMTELTYFYMLWDK